MKMSLQLYLSVSLSLCPFAALPNLILRDKECLWAFGGLVPQRTVKCVS